jgi:hypothetical protein
MWSQPLREFYYVVLQSFKLKADVHCFARQEPRHQQPTDEVTKALTGGHRPSDGQSESAKARIGRAFRSWYG